MLTRIVRPISRAAFTGVRQYHDTSKPYKYPSMDEVSVPEGSWQEHYDKNQRKFNAQLAAGILFFGASFMIAKSCGCFYLNWGPKLPEGYVIPHYYD